MLFDGPCSMLEIRILIEVSPRGGRLSAVSSLFLGRVSPVPSASHVIENSIHHILIFVPCSSCSNGTKNKTKIEIDT